MSPMLDRFSAVALRLEAAVRVGCEVVSLDPQTGYLNELRRDGRIRVLLGAVSPLNDAAAARLAGDKFHTATVLRRARFRVPRGVRCLRPGRFTEFGSHTGHEPALEFAEIAGFPLVVKPNGGSRGRNIAVVDEGEALLAAIEAIWRDDYLALVQQPVPGSDLRLDLLDGRCIFAYRRAPLRLEGDGCRSLAQLLVAADPRLTARWCARMLGNDPQWRSRVLERGLGLESILPAGERLDFDPVVLNLNRLCRGEGVEPVGARWLALGQRVARVMGLRHLGIDLKIQSLDQDPREAVVIEVNASPSLGNMASMGHYERVVAIEQEIVEAIMASAPAPEGASRRRSPD